MYQNYAFVLLISAMLHDTATDESQQMKPDIINQYNVTKGSIDVVAEMKGSYSVARKSNRWSFSFFFIDDYCRGKTFEIIFIKITR